MSKVLTIDGTTNRDKVNPIALMNGKVAGNWAVMCGTTSWARELTFQGVYQIVGYFANGDLKLSNGERVSSSTGKYKGSSAQRLGCNYDLRKAFPTKEEAEQWVAAEKAAIERRRNAETERLREQNERRAAQAEERRTIALQNNPEFLSNLRWQLTSTGQSFCSVEVMSNYGTPLLLNLTMTKGRKYFFGDDAEVYTVGMSIVSLKDGNVNQGAAGAEDGKDLNELLLSRLESACQYT